VALSHCDRGLSYVPYLVLLLAFGAAAAAATAQGRPDSVLPPTSDMRATMPIRKRTGSSNPLTAPPGDSGAPPAITSTVGATATAAPSEPMRKRPARWPWLVGIGLALWFGGIVVYLVVPERQPKPTTSTTEVITSGMKPEDRKVLGDFISVFDKAITSKSGSTPPPSRHDRPTTASGWLELAATQPPAEAVKSIREALALSPTWLDAQMALCAALAAAKDTGAIGACNVALQRRPEDVALLAARGAAHLEAGDAKAALIDLDKLVAKDPDPTWRRLRARARASAGDEVGAKKDLEHACQLGDAAACK
jgi:hypothetical protein